MSIEVMSFLWKTCLYEGNTLNTLMAMADWAEDDGGDIFPGIDLLAAKTRASVRTTQIALRRLEGDQVIERIANARGGRGKITEYKIDLERVQELQGLHEAAEPDCAHCAARRRSAERRAEHRAKRVQAGVAKGAGSRQKGAGSRPPIDNTHQQPPNTHHSGPAGAGESVTIASLGEGEEQRWPEFRSAVANTWPNGFPFDNEVACKAEFVRQTRKHRADLIIACANLHGAELRRRQERRGTGAGQVMAKLPSNWLKVGDWQGYIPAAEAAVEAEAKAALALARVRETIGDGLFDLLRRRGLSDMQLSQLDGAAFTAPAAFEVSGYQRALLERHIGALESHCGERPTFSTKRRAL
jgi:hypothetical protein